MDDLLIAAHYASASILTPSVGGRSDHDIDGRHSCSHPAEEPVAKAVTLLHPPCHPPSVGDDNDNNNGRTGDRMMGDEDDNEICLNDDDNDDDEKTPMDGDPACSKERRGDNSEWVSSSSASAAAGTVVEETSQNPEMEERIDPAGPSAAADGNVGDNVTTAHPPKDCSDSVQGVNDGDVENDMDDDDDESTVDLEAELARMTTTEADEEDEGIGGPASLAQPKTAHEVDIIDPAPQDDAVRVVPLTEEWLPRFHLAGALQHVLPDDTFTIVIVQANPNLLLEEGSAVWIHRVDDVHGAWAVVLGTIVEVFGPVRQPLYHVRLPKLPQKASHPAGPSNAPPQPTLTDGLASLDPPPSAPPALPNGPLQPEPPNSPPDSDPQVVLELSLPTNTLPQPTAPDDPPNTEPPSAPAPPVPVIGIPSPLPPNAPRPDSDSPGLLEPILQHIAPTSFPLLTLSALNMAARERQAVYYVPDEARPLDTAQVLRNSGRGCDASNWYDEEVDDAQQLDYSDDEQERAAKQRRNHKRHPATEDQRPASRNHSRGEGTRHVPSPGRTGGRGPARPPGFHQHHPHVQRHQPGLGAPPPPPPPPRRTQNGPGFHPSQPFQASPLLHPQYQHSPYHRPQAPPPLQYPIPSQTFPPFPAAPAPVIPPPPIRPPPPPPPPHNHDNADDNVDTIYYDYS